MTIKELKNELSRKNAEIEIFTKLTRAINMPDFQLDHFFKIIEEALLNYFQAGSYYICTYNSEAETVTMERFIDDGQRFPKSNIPLGTGFISHVIRTRKTFMVNDVEGNLDKLPVKPIITGKMKLPYSWLGVCIKRESEVIAVLNIANYEKKSFVQGDVKLLEAISEQISLAFEFYRNIEKIKESEIKYKDLVENLNDMIFTMDKRNRILSVNWAIKNILGYTPKEVIGKKLSDLLPEEYEERLSDYLDRIQRRKTARGKLDLFSKWGQRRVFEFNTTIIEQDGNNIGIRGVLRDITNKEATLEEIKKLKRLNEDIVNFSPVGIFTVDKEGFIAFENKSLQNIMERNESIIGKSLSEFTNLESQGINKMIFDAFEGKSSEKYNFLYKSPISQKELFITLMVSPIYDMDGKVDRALCLIEDTTKSVKLERQLIRTERLASVGIFASGIAHEINNPAFAILGMAETIIEEKDLGKITEYAEKIRDNIIEISDIVKQLSRYTSPDSAMGVSFVNINDILNDAAKMIEKSKEASDIEFITEFKDLPQIEANQLEMHQIFFNILSNSIDAIKDYGKIKIVTGTLNENLEIKISDTGDGIAPENIDKLFDPLFTTKDPGKGTGLGLNIVYRLVTKYKGTIDVKSSPGKGTTFVITLPIENA
ncbi:PAS domain S-box protein [candidate division KSB1 bacterium]